MIPITEQEQRDLRARNEARAKAAAEKLGQRYVFHPANHVKQSRYHSTLTIGRQLNAFSGSTSR